MAIAYDTGVELVCPTGTTTTSITVASTSNRYLFVNTSAGTTAITFDGVSLTKLNSNVITYNAGFSYVPNVSVWGLANPATGTKVLSVTTSARDDVIAAVYNDVDPIQAEAFATNQTNGNLTTFQTDYITTVTNNAWIATFVRGTGNLGRDFTAGASTTLRNTIGEASHNNAVGILDSNGVKSPVGSYELRTDWSSSQGWLSSVIYSIKPYLTATFTGPGSGNVNSASTNFTVTPGVAVTGAITLTPSGGGLTTPVVLNFSNSAAPQTFTITPTDSGVVTLTMTNTCGLNNAVALTYTANAVVPVAPTIGTAVPLNASASVLFTANSNGGSAITQFRAISTPGGISATGASSPITVTGLTNGVAYTFTARATNTIGNSVESSASNSVTPYVPASSITLTGPASGNVRSASTNFTVTPNSTYNGTITITPTGAGSTGLSPVILTFNLSAVAQTFTITPTSSGTVTLTCTNSMGITNASPLNYTANAVVPLAPFVGLAVPSLSSATVSFTAPTNDGGSAITLYTITSTPGGLVASTSQVGSVSVLGLTNGVSYTFSVTATNSVGTSASSSASNAVIPAASSTSFTNSGPKFNLERNVGNILSF